MWNELWGQMKWQQAAASVPAGSWLFALLLAFMLGLVAQRLLARSSVGSRSLIIGGLGLLLMMVAGVAHAVVPFTFVNGTTADAGQVNQNFAALDSAIAAVRANVNAGSSVIDETQWHARGSVVSFASGTGGAILNTGTDSILVGPTHVPGGAHITSVVFAVRDSDASKNLQACVKGLGFPQGSYTTYGSCAITSGATGGQLLTVTPAQIPNAGPVVLELWLTSVDASGTPTQWAGASLAAIGARIEWSF